MFRARGQQAVAPAPRLREKVAGAAVKLAAAATLPDEGADLPLPEHAVSGLHWVTERRSLAHCLSTSPWPEGRLRDWYQQLYGCMHHALCLPLLACLPLAAARLRAP